MGDVDAHGIPQPFCPAPADVSARRTAPVLLALCLAGGLLAGCDSKSDVPQNVEGDAGRGKMLIGNYGCGSCHLIPEVASADGNVGWIGSSSPADPQGLAPFTAPTGQRDRAATIEDAVEGAL